MQYRMLAVVGAMVALAAGSASANTLIPTLFSVTPSGSNFTYLYLIDLTNDQQILPGTNQGQVTLYDVGGLIPITQTCTPLVGTLTCTTGNQLLGPTPSGVLPTDSGSIPNVFVNISNTGAVPVGPGPTTVASFSFDSTVGVTVLHDFTSTAERFCLTPSCGSGTAIASIGKNAVPVPSPVSPIPEPASLMLLGTGLVGLGLGRRRARR